MNQVDLRFEQVAGGAYEGLLACALEHCDRIGIVLYPRRQEFFRGDAFLDELEPFLIERREATSWPGSELGAGWTAVVVTYRLTARLVRTLLERTSKLDDWGYPFFPDDPHLLRADGSVWFGSTLAEGWAWLELSPIEEAALVAECPVVARLAKTLPS